MTPVFWGLVRTPPEKRDPKSIETGKQKSIEMAKLMDDQLGRTRFLASDEFSYGDIPVGIVMYRFMQLVPERPKMPNLERWYDAISSRPAFKEQVAVVPLS
jgi:glutathione S-transferase